MSINKVETDLKRRLTDNGFTSVAANALRTPWCTTFVQSFVYLEFHAFRRENSESDTLSLSYGFKNEHVERFSYECLKLYGGVGYANLLAPLDWDCTNRFVVRGNKPHRPWQLSIDSLNSREAIEQTVQLIEALVQPALSGVVDFTTMSDALLSSDDAFTWIQANGARRCAQIAGLRWLIGDSASMILSLLKPYYIQSSSQLDVRRDAPLSERERRHEIFIENIVTYASAYFEKDG